MIYLISTKREENVALLLLFYELQNILQTSRNDVNVF